MESATEASLLKLSFSLSLCGKMWVTIESGRLLKGSLILFGFCEFENFTTKHLFFFLIFIFERERERDREGGAERETQNPKQTPGSKLSTQSLTRDSNPQTTRS